MSVLLEPVLVLNKSWTPITTYTCRKAFKKILSGKAKIVDRDCQVYDFESWIQQPLRDGDLMIPTYCAGFRVPEVIVLESDKGFMHRKMMPYSTRNLKKRDGHTCMYCGKKPSLSEQTVDHVIPKSRGGQSNWLNCVLACFPCNFKKSNRTLAESGMKLIRKPHEPKWTPTFRVSDHRAKESWKQFLHDATV